jgi:hypothetical protein
MIFVLVGFVMLHVMCKKLMMVFNVLIGLEDLEKDLMKLRPAMQRKMMQIAKFREVVIKDIASVIVERTKIEDSEAEYIIKGEKSND